MTSPVKTKCDRHQSMEAQSIECTLKIEELEKDMAEMRKILFERETGLVASNQNLVHCEKERKKWDNRTWAILAVIVTRLAFDLIKQSLMQ